MSSKYVLKKQGGALFRMMRALPQVVANSLEVRSIRVCGPPPPAAAQHAKEVCQYLARHYRRFDRLTQNSRRQSATADVGAGVGEFDTDSDDEDDHDYDEAEQ